MLDFIKKAKNRVTILPINNKKDQTLIFGDTETTGADDRAEIIQFAAIGEGKYNFLIDEYYSPKNGMKIEAMKVNQITEEMVKGYPTADSSSKGIDIIRVLNKKEPNAVFIAHNAKFDVAMLRQSANINLNMKIIDTQRCANHLLPKSTGFSLLSLFFEHGLYRNMEKTKDDLYYSFGVNIDNLTSHNAMYDIVVLKVLFDHLYNLSGKSINKLIELSETPFVFPMDTKMPFGKYRNKEEIGKVSKANPSYLRWCLENMDNLDDNWRATLKSALGSTDDNRNKQASSTHAHTESIKKDKSATIIDNLESGGIELPEADTKKDEQKDIKSILLDSENENTAGIAETNKKYI